MTVFLLILKIIGIVLLSILGLILLLLILLLYGPFRYKIAGEYNEETIDAEVSIRWLFIKAIAVFEKTAGLSVKAKVIGITVFKKDIPIGKKKEEAAEEDDLLEEALEELEEEEEATEEVQEEKSDKKKKDKDEKKSEQKADNKKEKDKKKKDKEEKEETSETTEEAADVLESSETDVAEVDEVEKQSLSDKIDSILEKVNEKVEMVQTKVNHVEQFLDQDYVQKTIRDGLKLIKKTLMSIRPRKGNVDLVLGLKSSADTGLMLAKMAPFYAIYGKWLHLTPDFYNKRIEAKGYTKGRIILGVIGFPILFYLLRRSTRRTIKLAKKI